MLKELFKDHQGGHSDLQMDCFITARAGGTPYGQYKQALRELHKRYRGLKDLVAQRALGLLDIRELEEKFNGTSGSLDRARWEIQIGQKHMALEELNHSLKDTEREFKRFYAQAVTLKEQVGELTPGRRYDFEYEMWFHNLKAKAALELLAHGRVDLGTLEAIVALPVELRDHLLGLIKEAREGLVAWLLKTPAEAPKLLDVECPELKQLGLEE